MAVFSKRKLFARAVLGKPSSSEKIFRRNLGTCVPSGYTSNHWSLARAVATVFTTESIQISVKKEGEEVPVRAMGIAYYSYKC